MPSGKGTLTASAVFEHLRSMHILVTSDKSGDELVVEKILKDDVDLSRNISGYYGGKGLWKLYYPERQVENLQVFDITLPEEENAACVLFGCCRGFESDANCSVMS